MLENAPKPPPANPRFNTTHWSIVLRAGGDDAADAKLALGTLIESYWYPLYAFARRRGHGDHDAMDLAQGFFAHLIAGDGIETARPDKGRFRSFLLASFTNYISNELRSAGALRRGGGLKTVSLSTVDFQTRYDREPADLETPEVLFQRTWVDALLTCVRARLHDEYRDAGKSELFDLLESHLLNRIDATPREEISKKLNLSTAAVAMSLHRMRRRYGELLRLEVAKTVNDENEVEDELRALIDAVGRTNVSRLAT